MTELSTDKRWLVTDRDGNAIYLTYERWEHIIELSNHPEMIQYEEELKATIRFGKRKQDPFNPQKYRYSKTFDNLAEYNTHIVAIILFRFKDRSWEVLSNNYIVTAFQKEIG